MRYLILIFYFLIAGKAHSQDIGILKKINEAQIKNDSFYHSGLFPSQRVNKSEKLILEDNNIFYTALINYTLQSIRDVLPKNDRVTIDSIFIKSQEVFNYYKNRNGGITYNFYQVRPENPFPNAKLFSRSELMELPDDLDDTSILYLIQDTSDSLNIAVKKEMEKVSLEKKRTASTFRRFRKSKTYKTWFSETMKQDIDICVMSNVLIFVIQKSLPLDTIDNETIALIKQVILEDTHLKSGHLISSHYQNSSILLYHVARLISIANTPELNDIRRNLINDIYNQMQSINNSMEKVILLTSLFRLNEHIDFKIDFNELENDMNKFYWFKANPYSGRRLCIKKIIMPSEFLQLKYKCKAYYWSLVLELQAISTADFSTDDGQQITMYKKY